MKPFVSIIWINYNSAHIIDKVLKSLESTLSLDYPRYEVIAIDNGSTDGSLEKIKELLNKKQNKAPARILQLDRNYGFTGAANRGFAARKPEAKYVVLLNNDAVPFPESLSELVEIMEAHPELGAAQGIIVEPDTGLIDTAGGYITEYLTGHLYRHGEPPSAMKKPIYISYADGAYSIWRVSAILEANKANKMFYDELFAYCDDNVLGAKLWTRGYPSASFPIVTARHKRSSTFKKFSTKMFYLKTQCTSFLYYASRKPVKTTLIVKLLRAKRSLWLGLRRRDLYRVYNDAWGKGRELAKQLLDDTERIDLHRVPMLTLSATNTAKLLLLTRLVRPDYEQIEKKYRLE